MDHNLNRLELPILLGAVADLERYRTMPAPPYTRDTRMVNDRRAIQYAGDGIVRVEASRWLGMGTDLAALRMGISRAYRNLERRGLIERVALGYSLTRCTHIAPTAAGIELARKLSLEISPPAEAATT
jgi:hypothetical protein